MRSFQIEGAKTLVTGAGSGIGQATATLFAEAGASHVVLVGRRESKLEETKEAILARASSCQVIVAPTDVGDAAEREALVKRLRRDVGGLDVLVNNAGAFVSLSLAETSDTAWREMFRVNVDAALALTRDFAEELKASTRPVVINVSSTLAEKPIPNTVAYNSAKAALVQMTRSLALELGPSRIRVNAVLPAVVETDMYRDRFKDEAEFRATLDAMASFHPIGRVGDPDDIAHAILFLASAAAAWITGVALPVDGGMLCT